MASKGDQYDSKSKRRLELVHMLLFIFHKVIKGDKDDVVASYS
jgi:hypothetical protein